MTEKVGVLILGIEGMLGSVLYKLFKENPRLEIVGTSRNYEGGDYLFDLNSGASALEPLIKDRKIQYVINCIGIRSALIDETSCSSIKNTYFVNSIFPTQLGWLCNGLGVKVIAISSNAVYSNGMEAMYERNHPSPDSTYGISKLLGEVALLNVINIRCSIIGPDFHKKINHGLYTWVENLQDGASIDGYTDHIWNGVTTLEYANLCNEILENNLFDEIRNKTPILHFAIREPITKYKLIKILASEMKKKIDVIPVQSNRASSQILASNYVSNFYKQKQKSIAEAVGELSAFMRS
jgi:dTDP-4-dehydrorhamnose reductase